MYTWLLVKVVSAWLLAPGFLLLLAGWGLMRLRKHPRSGKALIAGSMAALWVLSMPWVSHALIRTLQPEPADPLRAAPAQAIVVLGGGQYHAAPEYGADTVSEATLTRLRYAAHLQRKTGKPVLVSGGAPEGNALSEAASMKTVLETEFSVPVQWTEATSYTTLENARDSRALLAPLGMNRIYLVTHAWHMPRAQREFARAGFDVVPAPTQFATRFRVTPRDFMPHAAALRDSSHFIHEVIGMLWYRLKSALN